MSTEKLNYVLGLETLEKRRWCTKLFFGDNHSNKINNTLIFNVAIEFLIATKRCDVLLFDIEYGFLYW